MIAVLLEGHEQVKGGLVLVNFNHSVHGEVPASLAARNPSGGNMLYQKKLRLPLPWLTICKTQWSACSILYTGSGAWGRVITCGE